MRFFAGVQPNEKIDDFLSSRTNVEIQILFRSDLCDILRDQGLGRMPYMNVLIKHCAILQYKMRHQVVSSDNRCCKVIQDFIVRAAHALCITFNGSAIYATRPTSIR